MVVTDCEESTEIDELSIVQKSLSDACDEIKSTLDTLDEFIQLNTSQDGLGLLDLKNRLHVDYILGVCCVAMRKLSGKSLQKPVGKQLIEKLVNLRVVIDKMRPIEHRAKPIIDDILNKNKQDKIQRYKPNIADLCGSDESDKEYSDKDNISKSSVKRYVPSKIAPVPYPGDKQSAGIKQQRSVKSSLHHELLRDLNNEFSDLPMEVFQNSYNDNSSHQLSQMKMRREYEENTMSRLPTTKKDKKDIRQTFSNNSHGLSSIANFKGSSHLYDMHKDDSGIKKKSKYKKSTKAKRKSKKKKFTK